MSKNQDSFEKLVENYTPMIHHIIHALHIYKDFDQYYQLGLIALWEAAEKCDKEQGKFSGYAYIKIRGKMIDHLRNDSNYRQQVQLSNSPVPLDQLDENQVTPLEAEKLLSYCNGLTDKQLTWVKSTFLANKNMSEIAKEECVSIRAVRKWRDLALRQIKKNIENSTF